MTYIVFFGGFALGFLLAIGLMLFASTKVGPDF